jgi:hypothetical protein
MSLASRLPRTRQPAATLRLAASSVAPVASGYLRPCQTGVSPLARTIQPGGEL